MIFKERPPAPQHLVDEGEAEIAKVKAYYAAVALRQRIAAYSRTSASAKTASKKPKNPKSYKFTAYLSAKKDLEILFDKKCGYCETKYKPALTGEVEHYRPKGRIRGGDGKVHWPGYYWLAAAWTNLIPVCSMCNKKNVTTDHADGKSRTTGKGDWFPLVDESKRASPVSEPKDEDPLLLDPCFHKPAEHLTFFESNGHRALLKGLTEKGSRTIEILGLNRTDLVEDRRRLLTQLDGLMTDIQNAQKRATRSTTAEIDREEAIAEIGRKKAQLEAFRAESEEYAALCRYAIDEFFTAMAKIADPTASPP
jgi:5-methylcytosine-specific restriction endonuclease McrA